MNWKRKTIAAALLIVCLTFSLTGCSMDNSNIKDIFIENFHSLLQHFSTYALTDKKDLQGNIIRGKDTYTGSYTADYEYFNGKEYIFGGTSPEQDKENTLTITYHLKIDSGTASLYWMDKGKTQIIADTNTNGTYSFTIDEGDKYLILKGNDFYGTLHVTAE